MEVENVSGRQEASFEARLLGYLHKSEEPTLGQDARGKLTLRHVRMYLHLRVRIINCYTKSILSRPRKSIIVQNNVCHVD